MPAPQLDCDGDDSFGVTDFDAAGPALDSIVCVATDDPAAVYDYYVPLARTSAR